MHANEAFDSIAARIRGAERGSLLGAGLVRCPASRSQVVRGAKHAVVRALLPEPLTHFPGP